MSKYPEDLKKALGIKNELEFNFANPKKVLVKLDGFGKEEEIMEDVTSISVFDGPLNIAIELNDKSGSMSTAIENFKEILILD